MSSQIREFLYIYIDIMNLLIFDLIELNKRESFAGQTKAQMAEPGPQAICFQLPLQGNFSLERKTISI